MLELASLNLPEEFPILRNCHFFNHAGVAPISGRAAAAIRDFAERASSGPYESAQWYRKAKHVKELAAKLINARGHHEIAFVGNTSHGLSLVAKGIDWKEGDSVVITNVEYPANRYPWEDLTRWGVELIEVKQHADGRIDVEDVVDAVRASTRVVAISHVQYATGHRIDLKPISDMVHRAGGWLCVDAIQTAGVFPIDVQAMGIDFLSADGHKWLLGPEGAGIFYCHEDLATLLHPNVVGWMNMVNAQDYGNYQFEFLPDARRFEPGSYNIPGIMGLGASVDLLFELGVEQVSRRIIALTDRLCGGLEAKGYRVFSPRESDAEKSGIVTFEPPESGPGAALGPHAIVAGLAHRNIHVVVREGKLRASPHFYNGDSQIDALIEALP